LRFTFLVRLLLGTCSQAIRTQTTDYFICGNGKLRGGVKAPAAIFRGLHTAEKRLPAAGTAGIDWII